MKLILSILFLLLSTSAIGELDMNPKSIFLTSTVIKFIGEEGDVFGKWTVYFDMKDVLRDVTVSLQASFNLVE